MSLFDKFFSKQKNLYQSLYPEEVMGLTDKQKSEFDSIATQYKRLDIANPNTNTSRLERAFLDRYRRAIKEAMKIDVFLQVEREALDIYKKKQEQAHLKQEQAKTPLSPASKNKRHVFNRSTMRYPRIFIHEKANPELERLYGGLVEYEKKFRNGLLQSTKVINEVEFQQIVYGVVYSLEDLTHPKGKFLPFVFSQYSFELDNETPNQKQLEKEIYDKVSATFDKVKKIILWSKRVDQNQLTKNPFAYFVLDKVRIHFREFFDALKSDTQNLLDDFPFNSSL